MVEFFGHCCSATAMVDSGTSPQGLVELHVHPCPGTRCFEEVLQFSLPLLMVVVGWWSVSRLGLWTDKSAQHRWLPSSLDSSTTCLFICGYNLYRCPVFQKNTFGDPFYDYIRDIIKHIKNNNVLIIRIKTRGKW